MFYIFLPHPGASRMNFVWSVERDLTLLTSNREQMGAAPASVSSRCLV